MSNETLIIIVAFFVGGALVNWWMARNDRSKKDGEYIPRNEPPRPAPVWHPPARAGGAQVTMALIAISVGITLWSGLGKNDAVLAPFYISAPGDQGFQSIMNGQVWRLITPIFLHFGLMHILFNMFWLWDLGGLLERLKGPRFLLLFVAGVGAGSNVLQYLMTGSPGFGGMSGVLYGMLAYIWMQGRVNPRFGVILNQQVFVIMFGWYVLCWTGLLGPIANWAHTGGLALGLALGAQRPKR